MRLAAKNANKPKADRERFIFSPYLLRWGQKFPAPVSVANHDAQSPRSGFM
jgi:hypothetical protein